MQYSGDNWLPKWLPRTVLAGVLILSASSLLIVEMFPGQLKFVMEPASYLVFHNIAEFFSIMVSLSMFGVSWYTYEQSKNRHALFLGTAFLAIGLMDFMHTMSMVGMPDFITPNDPQKSVQFWIPVRLFQAVTFLASAYVYPDKPIRWLSKRILITSSLLVSLLVFIGIIFFQTHMPTFFVFGVGVTPLKKFCEYLVILLLCVATAAYWRRMEKTGERLLIYYMAAFVVSIFSELPLAFYARSFDTYNVLGHINKIVAFFLIYYGIYRASVKDPYIRLAETSERMKLQAGQYTTMLATSSDGFWLVGTDGRLVDVNDNYCRMSGYSRAELLNLCITDIEARETPEEVARHIRKIRENGFDRFETEHRTKNGGIMDVEASVSFWQAAGQMFLFVRNITDRKKAEAELEKYRHHLEELVKERTNQWEDANAQLRVEITERKQAEEEAQQLMSAIFEEKNRLSVLINSINDEIWFADTQKKFTLVNSSALREFGFGSAESGIDVEKLAASLEVLRPDGSPRPVEEAPPLRALQGEVIKNQEEIIRTTGSGEFRHRQVSAAPVRSPEGHIIGSVSVVRDITERRRAEEALRASEVRFKSTMDNMMEGCQIIGRDWRYIYLNDAADRHNRRPKEELLGNRYMEMWPGIETTRVFAVIRRCMEEQISQAMENEFTFPDGTTGWFDLRIEPVPEGVFILSMDITERKRMEEELRQAEEKSRLLIKYAPSMLYEIDFHRPAFKSVNNAMCQFFGYTREELLAMNPFDLLDDEGKAVFRERIRRKVAGEDISDSVEYKSKTKDGREVYGVLNMAFTYKDGKPEGAVVVAHDLTERKRAEEELRRNRDELEDRVRERTADLRESEQRLRRLSAELLNAQERERRLVAQEIHDSIGASLAATKFKVESALAQISADNPQTKELLESVFPIIQETVNEARRIQMNLRPSILDDLGILATIGWFCRQYESTYSAIHIKQEIHIEEHEVNDSLKTVIFRVLQEALNNVAKHSKANEVLLSLRKTDQAIQLVVRDNGHGFMAEDVLFRKRSNRGLGLDSMRERTELAGGTFTIESTDSGTVILASWPL